MALDPTEDELNSMHTLEIAAQWSGLAADCKNSMFRHLGFTGEESTRLVAIITDPDWESLVRCWKVEDSHGWSEPSQAQLSQVMLFRHACCLKAGVARSFAEKREEAALEANARLSLRLQQHGRVDGPMVATGDANDLGSAVTAPIHSNRSGKSALSIGAAPISAQAPRSTGQPTARVNEILKSGVKARDMKKNGQTMELSAFWCCCAEGKPSGQVVEVVNRGRTGRGVNDEVDDYLYGNFYNGQDLDPVVLGKQAVSDGSPSVDEEREPCAVQCTTCLGSVNTSCLAKSDLPTKRPEESQEEMSEGTLVDETWWALYCCCSGFGCLEEAREPNLACDCCLCSLTLETADCSSPSTCIWIDSCCCCTQLCMLPLLNGYPRCIMCGYDFCGVVGGYLFSMENREHLELVELHPVMKTFDRATVEEFVACSCFGCGIACQPNCSVRTENKCCCCNCSLLSVMNGCGLLLQCCRKCVVHCRVYEECPCFCSCCGYKCPGDEEEDPNLDNNTDYVDPMRDD